MPVVWRGERADGKEGRIVFVSVPSGQPQFGRPTFPPRVFNISSTQTEMNGEFLRPFVL